MNSSPLDAIHEQDVLTFNKEYRLLTGGCDCCDATDIDYGENNCGKFCVQNTITGAKVETDDVGKIMLENLPAPVERLYNLFKTQTLYVAPRLIGYYLLLFQKAGIIKVKGTVDDIEREKPIITGTPAISVVIVTFNGKKFIGKNLASLARQTLPATEIIVVDNASSDETLDIIRNDYKDVTIIANPTNVHYARAVNIGVEAAANELVFILNQDIELEADCLAELYSAYQQHHDETTAGIVPQMRLNKLRHFINGIGNFISTKDWGSDNYFGVVDIGQFETLRTVGSACFGAIMVTKTGWEKVGPLDTAYKSFYEDADWSIRTHKQGLTLLAAPRALVYHEFGGSYPSGLKLSFVVKNRMRFVLKNVEGKLMRRIAKTYLKHDIKSALYHLRRRNFGELVYYWKAYFRLALQLPGLLVGKLKKASGECVSADDFFTKGYPYVVLANRSQDPVINRHTIRAYYYFLGEDGFEFPQDPIRY